MIENEKTMRNYNEEFADSDDEPAGRKYSYDFDFDVMHRFMLRASDPFIHSDDVLELGSYKGDFTLKLLEKYRQVTCVEASSSAVAIARDRVGDAVKTFCCTFEECDLDQKFSAVFLTHVLEHIEDSIGLLMKIRDRWLSDDGVLIVIVPNAHAASRQIANYMGIVHGCESVTVAERKQGHVRTYTLDSLTSDCTMAGLRIVDRKGIFFKALANFQWDEVIRRNIVSEEYLDACYKLGFKFPELCSSIMVVCKR